MLVALAAERIPLDHLDIDGRVRQNVTLTEPDGTTTKVNEPGPVLSAAEADALVALVIRHARRASWLVLAGSLPPGLDDDFHARVVQAVRAELGDAAPRIAVDSSGAPMAALVASGAVVDLVKPNAEELAEFVGLPDPDALEADPGWPTTHPAPSCRAAAGRSSRPSARGAPSSPPPSGPPARRLRAGPGRPRA
ncbi:Tagatose-6-phosphate kinase [Clavibacter michiganensis subsp. michiganensis]|nr:Tagatose-6-phosphate kinase [Clavibacter michiganensis subsp. michiganensis]